ncbi:MAG TPA: glycoside hydrolase family 2 TIM barrel-domain containing protein [Solirubrobacteraceae bacterium]|nr:glycoside hydrolase family 2 TIM barrel-domain containing protein [Solirubrobacteraceae bacterium]
MIRRALLRSVLLTALISLGAAGVAQAQGPAYTASPPSKNVWYQDGQTGRYLLGGEWLYQADPGNVGLSEGWWRDVASTDGWTPVTVPNAYNAGNFSQASMNGYVGWYRRDFTLPAGAFDSYVPSSGRHWIIRFESVNYRATVWLNGHEIGSHAGAQVPFEFDLSYLHKGVNRLIVRVDNERTAADLPPGPGGQWFNYGGILREVYLRSVQDADLQRVVIRTLHPCPKCAATIQEQVLVRNVTGSRQRVSLRGAYGHAPIDFGSATIAPHGTWTANASTKVPHPSLWAPGHPKLYAATLTLSDSHGRRLGGYFTYSGIRTIKVVDGRLQLNGRFLNLRGVDLHEQTLQTGAAMDPAQIAQLMSWVRDLGATVIRAHYPVGPEMEELADKYGILIWSEVPVYQVKNEYLSQPAWLAQAHAMLEDNILSNENHPSILLWSIGNELPSPATPAEGRYISGAVALAHRLDPTRPVGMAVSNWPGLGCQPAWKALDVIGDNEYFGWFDAGGGLDDDRDALSPFLDTVRACYPKQAIMITEFGFDANRDGPVEERGTYAFQSNSVAFHLGVFASKPWLSGAMYFVLQDYVAFPTYSGGNPLPDPPFNQKGLLDINGNPKPAWSVVSQIYHSTQQIAP